MRGKKIALYAFTVTVLCLLIVNATSGMNAAKEALMLCADTVIPTLFPFFVLSTFMIETGFLNCAGRILSPLSKRVFRTSGVGAVVFVIGLMCGYPTGAKMVADLYRKKAISKNEAKRLLPFCNNSGPLFVIGAVGAGMLQNIKLGVLLYGVHAVSAILVGVFFSFFAKHQSRKPMWGISCVRLGKAVSNAVYQGVQTMLLVCGFVVFFAVLRSYCVPVFSELFGTNGAFLLSFAEVTSGAKDICMGRFPFSMQMVMLSGTIGFGGVCVLLQVCGVVSDTDLGVFTYLCGKVLQMILSMAIMGILL